MANDWFRDNLIQDTSEPYSNGFDDGMEKAYTILRIVAFERFGVESGDQIVREFNQQVYTQFDHASRELGPRIQDTAEPEAFNRESP